MIMNRRDMLRLALATAGVWRLPATRSARAEPRLRPLPDATPKHLPRWRGFNLLDKFMVDQQKPFEERDFADIAELGFDFVRLPLDYRCWTDRDSPKKLKEPVLKEIDQAVELGRKHGVHVQINFHRAPGYTVASPPEPKSLWTDPEILDVCAAPLGELRGALSGHAEQPASASTRSTSPTTRSSRRTTARVVERIAAAIRASAIRKRLIVCDGRAWATVPPDRADRPGRGGGLA